MNKPEFMQTTMFGEGDIKPIPKRKTPPKRTAPVRTWESDTYLPNLKEAAAYNYDLLTDDDLVEASGRGEIMIFDIESYSNYFLLAFRSVQSGKVVLFEMWDSNPLDVRKIQWILDHFTIVGFNSNSYDMPILAIALAGASASQLWLATVSLIVHEERPQAVLKSFRAYPIVCDHIDLIEVCPLSASLKVYSGRLDCPTIQDLPFKAGSTLSLDHSIIIKWYCVNDLINTEILYKELEEAIELRVGLGKQYGLELRSKSDAQIAEAVIGSEIQKLTGFRVQRPPVLTGQAFRYRAPNFLQFETPKMNRALGRICELDFIVTPKGSVATPQYLTDSGILIGKTWYKVGIGGLHSMEKRQAGVTNDDHYIVDMDVASYYPAIILNCGLYPDQLGVDFLTVYRKIVEQRLAAKAAKNSLVADTLKIVINGSFGKLGSMYSILYSPNLLIQVTLTGQLSLLMLIERLELQGVQVISANTDGIVIKAAHEQEDLVSRIARQWEKDTNFHLESTFYERIHNRDVNNYIALTVDGKVKAKGAYAKSNIRTNPTNQICVEAIEALLTRGTPVEKTIRGCTDITKFLTLRTVKGGAVKGSEYLGKAVRWYYSNKEYGVIVYANNGNKVPNSDGAMPAMKLPNEIPKDLDYLWYIRETNKMLDEIDFS